MNNNSRLELLERSIMELGADLISVKSSMNKYKKSHAQLLQIFKGLKQLLDEKGLVTLEDFDAAIEIGEVLEYFNAHLDAGSGDQAGLKKVGH
jgi:hypothetical protein